MHSYQNTEVGIEQIFRKCKIQNYEIENKIREMDNGLHSDTLSKHYEFLKTKLEIFALNINQIEQNIQFEQNETGILNNNDNV